MKLLDLLAQMTGMPVTALRELLLRISTAVPASADEIAKLLAALDRTPTPKEMMMFSLVLLNEAEGVLTGKFSGTDRPGDAV